MFKKTKKNKTPKATKAIKVIKKRANRRSSNEPQGVKIAQYIVRITKGLFIGAAAAVFLGVVVWLYTALTIHPYLDIKSIEVRGEIRLDDEDVVNLSGIESGSNIIKVNIKETEKNIRANDFIKSVTVKRILPDKVVIDVEEFIPVAFVTTGGLYVMDNRGEIFKKFSPMDELDLPVITGLENVIIKAQEQESLKVMALDFIESTRVSAGLDVGEVSEVHVDSIYGVTAYTTREGVALRLGSGGFEKKIANLKTFLDSRENGLKGIKSVDLDNDRGIIVDFKEGSGSEA